MDADTPQRRQPSKSEVVHWNHPDHWLRAMTLIFLLAFALRLGFCMGMIYWNRTHPETTPSLPVNIDGYEYIAFNLLSGNGFSSDIMGGESDDFRPNLYRTPGYPILLTGIKWVFGHGRPPIYYLHAVLGAVTAALVFWLARRFWGTRVGLWAGVFAACDPISVLWTVYPRAETLLTTCTVAGVCLLVAGGQKLKEGHCGTGYLRLLGAGFFIALAALTKPIAIYLVFPLLLLLFILTRKLRPTAVGMALILAIWVLLCGGWMWRNYSVTARVNPEGKGVLLFSTISSENLLAYRAAHILALAEGKPLEKVAGRLRDEVHTATGSPQRTIEYANIYTAKDVAMYDAVGLRVIREYPWLALRVQAAGMARLLFGPGELATLTLFGIGLPASSLNDMERRGMEGGYIEKKFNEPLLREHRVARNVVRGIGWGWLAVLYPLAVIGLVKAWRGKQWVILAIVLIPIFYYAGLAGGPEANSRFRVPLIPFVAILAGCGVGWRRSPLDVPVK